MNVAITQRAMEEIEKHVKGQKGFIKIYYDDKDCGCAGGVPTLHFVGENALKDDPLKFETPHGTVLMEKVHQLYFDEDLKIDFSEKMNLFQLKSPSGILNPIMKLEIKQ